MKSGGNTFEIKIQYLASHEIKYLPEIIKQSLSLSVIINLFLHLLHLSNFGRLPFFDSWQRKLIQKGGNK
jgi:hypothetical protein